MTSGPSCGDRLLDDELSALDSVLVDVLHNMSRVSRDGVGHVEHVLALVKKQLADEDVCPHRVQLLSRICDQLVLVVTVSQTAGRIVTDLALSLGDHEAYEMLALADRTPHDSVQ